MQTNFEVMSQKSLLSLRTIATWVWGQIPSLSSCDRSEPSCVFRQLSSNRASLWVYHSSLPTQAGAVFSDERIAF